MIEELQTLCMAVLLLHHSAAAAGTGAAPPPPIDFRAFDALFEVLSMRRNPGLEIEAARALLLMLDRLAPEQQRSVQEVAIPLLIERLSSSTDERAKTKAGNVVREIVNGGDGDARQNAILGPMVRSVMGDDPAVQLERTRDFLAFLAIRPDPPVRRAAESGVVPRLVEFLHRDEDPDLQNRAASVLHCMAAGGAEPAFIVAKAGAIPALVRLLPSHDNDLPTSAAWGLGAIAMAASRYGVLVLEHGALQPLVELALGFQDSEQHIDRLRASTYTLTLLCSGPPLPSLALARPALPALARLITHEHEEIVVDACGALQNMAGGSARRIQAVIDAGVCPRVVELLRHPSAEVQRVALGTVCNIFSGSHQQKQAILDHDGLPCIRTLMASPHSSVQALACSVIANFFVMGRKEHIQEAIAFGIVPSLIQLVAGSDISVREQAVLAIGTCVTWGSVDQVQDLIEAGCIPSLWGALSVDAAESAVVSHALWGLEKILFFG